MRTLLLMAFIAVILLATGINNAWCALDYSHYTDNQIVDAIKKTENSIKYPYGIKSIKCSGEKECRQICLNSVRNGRKRWIKAGKPDDLVVFIGKRYSPPDINPNWVRLVKHFLNKT